MDNLIIYGSPASPPSRSVYWTCLRKELPFSYVQTEIDQMGTSSVIKRYNPTGQVPTLRDGDFSLSEMPAILAYLCEKHGWDDLYPTDLQIRAKINQYLHFHHNFTRNLSWKLMGTHVMSTNILDMMGGDLGDEAFNELVRDPKKLERGQATANEIASLIDQTYFASGSPFLCTDHPTVADLACYEEAMAVKHACLFDFADFPRIQKWMDQMEQLPLHEPVHRYNLVLGDIQSVPNTIERLMGAVAAGVEGLQECGVTVSALDRD